MYTLIFILITSAPTVLTLPLPSEQACESVRKELTSQYQKTFNNKAISLCVRTEK